MMPKLIKGNYYEVLPHPISGIRVTDNPVRYLGKTEFGGVTFHSFWDVKTRLNHWIDPERVIEYVAKKGNNNE